MSRLDELIAELCPDGVEYRQLCEVANIQRGVRVVRKQLSAEGTYPVYQNSLTPLGYHNEMNCEGGTTFVICAGAAGDVGFSTVDFWAADDCHYCKSTNNLLSRYLYHVLLWQQPYLYSQVRRGSIPRLSRTVLEKIKIPVPPLPVQREIVKMLDNFTELTAELTARQKQYEYYRDYLIDLNPDVPKVKLKDIATNMFRGAGIKRDEVTEEGIPCVRYGEIYTTYNTWFEQCVSHTDLKCVPSPKYFEHGDILFVITGESIEDIAKSVAYLGYERCLAGGDIVVMQHEQEPRYLAHALSTTAARLQKGKGKVKSKVVHSNVSSIEAIEIPLPPIEVQKQIADILDKFERIFNDIGNGLPAEIAARKKQYEYYRNKLLSFKMISK